MSKAPVQAAPGPEPDQEALLEDSAEQAPPHPGSELGALWPRALGAALRSDPLVKWTVGLFGVTLLVYLVPGLRVQGWGGSERAADPVAVGLWLLPAAFLALVITALRKDLGHLAHVAERRFWNSLAGALALWLAAYLTHLPGPAVAWTEAAGEVLFGLGYLALVLAVERRSLRRYGRRRSGEQALLWPGVAVLVLGLLIYFVVIPLALGRQSGDSQLPTLYLYVGLDVYLALGLLRLAHTARTARWRTLYTLLALATAILLARDLLAVGLRTLALPGHGHGFAALTNAAAGALALAGRLRHVRFPDRQLLAARRDVFEEQLAGPTPRTVAAALALPLLHLASYRLDLLDVVARPARELLVLVWLVLLGALAAAQHRSTHRRVRQTWQERAHMEESLRDSQEDLRLMVERYHTQERLRLSEQKFATAFRASPDAMAISALKDGRLIEVNESFAKNLGYSRDEILGHTSAELAMWADPEQRLEMIRTLQREGAVRGMELVFRRRSGELITGLLSAERINIEGEPCLLSVTHDITERKQFEERIRQQVELLDTASDALSMLDAEGRITFWNQSAERLFGWAAEEVIGEPIDEVLFPRQRSAAAHRGLSADGDWIGELTAKTKDGADVAIESWWTVARDAAGRARSTLVISTAVAARGRGAGTPLAS